MWVADTMPLGFAFAGADEGVRPYKKLKPGQPKAAVPTCSEIVPALEVFAEFGEAAYY